VTLHHGMSHLSPFEKNDFIRLMQSSWNPESNNPKIIEIEKFKQKLRILKDCLARDLCNFNTEKNPLKQWEYISTSFSLATGTSNRGRSLKICTFAHVPLRDIITNFQVITLKTDVVLNIWKTDK